MADLQRSQFQEAREALARGAAEPKAGAGAGSAALVPCESTQFRQAKEALARANQESQKENQPKEGLVAAGARAPGAGTEVSQFKQAKEALARGREEESADGSREKPMVRRSESTQFHQAKEALARRNVEVSEGDLGEGKAAPSSRKEEGRGEPDHATGIGSTSSAGAVYQRQESTQFRQAKEALANAQGKMPEASKKDKGEAPASESTQFRQAKAALAQYKQQVSSREKEVEGSATRAASSGATQFQQAKAALIKQRQERQEGHEAKVHKAGSEESTQFKQAKAALNQWWTKFQVDDENSLDTLRRRRQAYNAGYKQAGPADTVGMPTILQPNQGGPLSGRGEEAPEPGELQIHEATQGLDSGMPSHQQALGQWVKSKHPGTSQLAAHGAAASSLGQESDGPRTPGAQGASQLVRSLSEISVKELQATAGRKGWAPQEWDTRMLLVSGGIGSVQESDISAALQVDAGEILRLHRQMLLEDALMAAENGSLAPSSALAAAGPRALVAGALGGEGQLEWRLAEGGLLHADAPRQLPTPYAQQGYPPSTNGMFPFCTIL